MTAPDQTAHVFIDAVRQHERELSARRAELLRPLATLDVVDQLLRIEGRALLTRIREGNDAQRAEATALMGELIFAMLTDIVLTTSASITDDELGDEVALLAHEQLDGIRSELGSLSPLA